MALETGSFIDDLVDTNPPGTDPKKQGDDHLRLIKSILKGTFPDAPRAFHFPNAPAAKTGNYTVVLADQNALITVDATAAARTVTLPTFASVFAGFSVTIQKSDTSVNIVTVDGNGAETINGDATKILRNPYDSITVTSDGSDWKVRSRGADEVEHTGFTNVEFVRKTATEIVNNSATLQDDDDLFVALAANEIVAFQCSIIHDGNATADFKMAFTIPVGASIQWSLPNANVSTANTLASPTVQTASGAAFSMEAQTARRAQFAVGVVRNGGTTGNLQLQWAQDTATVVNTQVYLDSFLLVTRV